MEKYLLSVHYVEGEPELDAATMQQMRWAAKACRACLGPVEVRLLDEPDE